MFKTIRTLFGKISSRHSGPAVLYPECTWTVMVDAWGVACQDPEGEIGAVAWDDLQVVIVETNNLGPWMIDVIWHLQGERGACWIPQGATGESEMIERLTALPGFDGDALGEAMRSVRNETFLCWSKDGA